MARDPWKRAHQLKRMQHPGLPSKPESYSRRRIPWGWIGTLILAVLVLGAAATVWLMRGWWVPRYREQLPPAVTTVVPEPPADVDWSALESGFGFNLSILGSYLDLLSACQDKGPQWKASAGGESHLRLTAPGAKVYVQDGLIWAYELELGQVFTDEQWKNWRTPLREAGLTPDLTDTSLTGDSEMPVGHTEHEHRSRLSRRYQDGWAYPVFILHFQNGWLVRLQAGMDFGVSEPMVPDEKG